MSRTRRDGTRLLIAAGYALVMGLSSACATIDAEGEARPKQPAAPGNGFWTTSDRAKFETCYAEERAHDPKLAVHTAAWFFARDGKALFVDLDLPQTPHLARCLGDVIANSTSFEGLIGSGSGAISVGVAPVDLGPPSLVPLPRPTLAEMRARQRRMTLAAFQQGTLRESDAPVRELLHPAPPWPSAAMRAELDACYQVSLKSHPGLVLHRDVIYLARGSKVLLADVSIPEAPELRSCVLERIVNWISPFSSSTGQAISSGFFIDLGAPEELPPPPASLSAELDRRRVLVQRARELGLIAADDPLLERFKPTADAPSHDAERSR